MKSYYLRTTDVPVLPNSFGPQFTFVAGSPHVLCGGCLSRTPLWGVSEFRVGKFVRRKVTVRDPLTHQSQEKVFWTVKSRRVPACPLCWAKYIREIVPDSKYKFDPTLDKATNDKKKKQSRNVSFWPTDDDRFWPRKRE